MELAEDVPKVMVGGALGVVNLGELPADGGEEVVDVEEVEYLLVDGDEDEAEVVVEGPLEGVVVLGEAGVGGALLEEAGADERVDRGALEGGGAERPAGRPEDEAAPGEDEQLLQHGGEPTWVGGALSSSLPAEEEDPLGF